LRGRPVEHYRARALPHGHAAAVRGTLGEIGATAYSIRPATGYAVSSLA